MKIRLIIGVLLILPICASYGASFSCAKAQTHLEKLICLEPTLNEADTQMGESYNNAVLKFPITGFIEATQKLFLSGFRNCDDAKNTKTDIQQCSKMLNDRTRELNDYTHSKVYTNSKGKYKVEDVVITLSGTGNNAVLRYFGSWMPDAYDPKPFPAGFICNDEIKLVPQNDQLIAKDTELSKIKISEDKINMDVMCSPRTSIVGDYLKLNNRK